MLNYFTLIILTLLILITHNIILLNEETLILVCFIVFCWLMMRNLSSSIKHDLDSQSTHIKQSIEDSLKEIIEPLAKISNVQNNFWSLFFRFKLIGNHCIRFVNSISDWSISYKNKLNGVPFLKRFRFIFKLEKQMMRLIILLLIRKLNHVLKLKFFYSHKVHNSYFSCLNKINIRECLQLINK